MQSPVLLQIYLHIALSCGHAVHFNKPVTFHPTPACHAMIVTSNGSFTKKKKTQLVGAVAA